MQAETQATQVSQSEVVADLVFLVARRAPDVQLSFNGLAVPTALFADLSAIGWGVPSVPPPPGSAIEWTPNPATGEDYTLKPWRVKEFRLRQNEAWTSEDEKLVGERTILVLRSHGAEISGVRGLPAEPAAQADPSAAPASAGTPGAAASVAPAPGSAITIIVEQQPPAPTAGCVSYSSVSSRQKDAWVWSEGPVLDAAVVDDLNARGAHVWNLASDTRPQPSAGTATLHLLAIGKDADKGKVAKLEKSLGDQTVSYPLIAAGKEAGALVTAVIPANAVEMMLSNVRLRFPKVICRGAALS